MWYSDAGSFRVQASFLRRQFLRDGDLPFTSVLTEEVISQALSAPPSPACSPHWTRLERQAGTHRRDLLTRLWGGSGCGHLPVWRQGSKRAGIAAYLVEPVSSWRRPAGRSPHVCLDRGSQITVNTRGYSEKLPQGWQPPGVQYRYSSHGKTYSSVAIRGNCPSPYAHEKGHEPLHPEAL